MSNDATPPRRKRTARFIEIAEAAGVSLATVDRVLNERGSVSAATRACVVAAARQLAVPRILPDTRHGLIHVDVLLPQNSTPFFGRLNLALQRSMQMLDKRQAIEHWKTVIGGVGIDGDAFFLWRAVKEKCGGQENGSRD